MADAIRVHSANGAEPAEPQYFHRTKSWLTATGGTHAAYCLVLHMRICTETVGSWIVSHSESTVACHDSNNFRGAERSTLEYVSCCMTTNVPPSCEQAITFSRRRT